MTTHRPFKFIVQMILLEQDSEGNPLGEKVSDPVPIYGIDGLRMFVDNLAAQVNEDGTLRDKPDILIPGGGER